MKLDEIQKLIEKNWSEAVSKNALEEIAEIIINDAMRRVDAEGGRFDKSDTLALGRDQGFEIAGQVLEGMKLDYES